MTFMVFDAQGAEAEMEEEIRASVPDSLLFKFGERGEVDGSGRTPRIFGSRRKLGKGFF